MFVSGFISCSNVAVPGSAFPQEEIYRAVFLSSNDCVTERREKAEVGAKESTADAANAANAVKERLESFMETTRWVMKVTQ